MLSASDEERVAHLPIRELARSLDAGELSATRLVELYRSRIERLDHAGPGVNAVLEVDPDAPAVAALAVALPVNRPPYLIDVAAQAQPPAVPSTLPSSMSGYPMVTVPSGYAFGHLPLGICLLGRPGGDAAAGAGRSVRARVGGAPPAVISGHIGHHPASRLSDC
ncbi:hypothetical protein [Spongiactinospora sp. TRM90649]|uniref:hypothetical protein n=1 Tax=Spongiactinospora sp. TRM90649 TaxID=3031114 RepID=UPI0023FA330B|nr:hypothetical protein [Spongiactinospora sp. TRM90649]MDF5756222.1 hypothetical protein [Spongiactinospora sp. TRM90649]